MRGLASLRRGTKVKISREELEARVIYASVVAGKSADFADEACKRLWVLLKAYKGRQGSPEENSPFWRIRRVIAKHGSPDYILRLARTGNYTKLTKCLHELVIADVDLATCKPSELEAIHGIGPKTSRFFITWTRPEARYAVLDTHILRWMRKRGHDAPESTPSMPRYKVLEDLFLAEADKLGLTPRQLDYALWKQAAGREQEDAHFRP